jgi:coatomer subunit beta
VVEKFPALREPICSKLIATLPTIKSAKVYRGVFWILGEYTEDLPEISQVFQQIRKVLGEVPILASEQRAQDVSGGDEEADGDGVTKAEGGRPKLLADGTYATETAYSSAKTESTAKASNKPPLRGALH